MKGTMKAWRMQAEGQFPVLEEISIPRPKNGEVLVKMGGAGICRTDLEIISGIWKDGEGVGPFPFTLGHENAGWIAEFGSGTENCGFSMGEAVVIEAKTHCGYCELCRTGETNFCSNARTRGCEADGGLAEYMITTPKEMVSLGKLDPSVYAVLGDAGMASYGPIRDALTRITPASFVVIYGTGGLAGFAVQYAKVLTSATVIVIDKTTDERLDNAVKNGADYSVYHDGAAYERVLEITGGKLIDAFFDFAGNTQSMYLASKLIKIRGIISVTGCNFDSEFRFNWATMKPGVDMHLYQGATIKDLTSVVSLVKRGLVIAEVQQYGFYDLPKAIDDLKNHRINGRGVITFDCF